MNDGVLKFCRGRVIYAAIRTNWTYCIIYMGMEARWSKHSKERAFEYHSPSPIYVWEPKWTIQSGNGMTLFSGLKCYFFGS